MYTSNKENESSVLEVKKELEIEIGSFHISDESYAVSVDVRFTEWSMTILGFQVFYSINDDKINVEIPENFCPSTMREFKTLHFDKTSNWIQIKEYIEEEVRDRKWLMDYLTHR
jgi:hypothetical protein